MAKVARERVSVDLRGLAPALKAHARARHLSLSQVARLALVAVLPPTHGTHTQPAGEANPEADRLLKLTIRLHRSVAAQLSERARNSGLSQGAYLTTLIEGAPAPPLAVAKALAASTEQLSLVAANASEMLRLMQKEPVHLAADAVFSLRGLVDGTHTHLGLASRLVAELRPSRVAAIRPMGAQQGVREKRHEVRR